MSKERRVIVFFMLFLSKFSYKSYFCASIVLSSYPFGRKRLKIKDADMKKMALLFICLLLPIVAEAQYSVSSPDMAVRVRLNTEWKRNLDTKRRRPNGMKMSVSLGGRIVLRNKEIGLEVLSDGHRYSFGKSEMKVLPPATNSLSQAGADDARLAALGSSYNRLILQSSTGIELEVRVFNHGVAYRFAVTGYPAEYKILNVSDVFPNERPNAIVGTFTDKKVLPWRIMNLDDEEGRSDGNRRVGSNRVVQGTLPDEWESIYPSRKIVSWKDALSSVSIGMTIHSITGKRWGDVSESMGWYGDFTYKYLYGGLSFTPCHELLYLYYDYDYDPFIGVIGSVHSWDVTGRFGFNLPVQSGYDVWHFTPYAAVTYLALRQHGETRVGYKDVADKHHYLMGMGLKVQYMMHGRASLGMGYEYQFFTGRKEPIGRHGFLFTLGFCL